MQGSIAVNFIPNPFDLLGVEAREITIGGRSAWDIARGLLAERYPLAPSGFEWVVSINGVHVPEDVARCIVPTPADRMAVAPVVQSGGGGGGGGKNVGRTVAMLAVVAATIAMPTLGAGIGAVMGMGMDASIAFGYAMAGATFLGGSMLVNAAFPSTLDTAGLSTSADWGSESSTYGWNTSGNPVLNGGPLPVVYGTMRVTPPRIGQYVYTEDDQQYLRLLYAVAGHEVDSISGVRMNGNDAEDYATVETRLGTVGQSVIKNFQDTYLDKSVGVTIPEDGSWTATFTTDGTGIDALGVGILGPEGVGYIRNNGTFAPITLSVEIQYKLKTSESWSSMGTVEITAAQNSAVRRFYRVEDLERGQYDVRARFATPPSDGARYRNKLQVEYLQEVVYDDFAYPGVALLALDALATDQLSGSVPEVDCLVTRSLVDVWDGAAWGAQAATSPAWATWDALHNEVYGGGADEARFVFDDFDAWATHCTALGLACNIYYDSAAAMPMALTQVGQVGRGRIQQRGLQIGAVYDGEMDPVYTFDDGNIVADSFKIEYLKLDDRANIVDVTFFDALDDDYDRKTISVISDDYNAATDEPRSTAVTLYACTSKAIAHLHARYLLRCNRYLRRTASWESPIDAIHCQVGDVVTVQHSLPAWGFGGHVVSATATSVTVDQEVTIEESKTYKVLIRHKDDTTEEVAVTNSPGTTDTLSVAAWATQPQQWEHWIFGEDEAVGKPFKVLSIVRSDDLLCRISALEYRSEVYTDAEEIPEYESGSSLALVDHLIASEAMELGADGTVRTGVALSWSGFALGWNVHYRLSGASAWVFWGKVYEKGVTLWGLPEAATYEFSVSAGAAGTGQIVELEFLGKTAPPSDVASFSAQQNGVVCTFKWPGVSDGDLAGYELRYMAAPFVWESAIAISRATRGTLVTNSALPPGAWIVGIKAIDTSGNYSDSAAVCAIDVANANDVVADAAAPAWLGTATDMVEHPVSGVLVPESTELAGEQGWETFDEFLPSPVAAGYYEVPEIDLGFDASGVRVWHTASGALGPGETEGNPDIELEIDWRTEGGSYGGWRPWTVGSIDGRYIKARVKVDPAQGAAYLSAFALKVDVPKRTEEGSGVAVAVGGTTINFAQRFYGAPCVTTQALGAAVRYCALSGTTAQGFVAQVLDASGSDVGGTINWTATGA